jgi:hypothetical protein
MSRRESDREDLLREATALVERAEIRIPGENEPIVVGFRRDGSASFFFGADPVYQFNSTGEFRRGYIGGLLYKAERGQLISLRRERSETEVALLRDEMPSNEADPLLTTVRSQLAQLHDALASGSFTLVGEVPTSGGIIERTLHWLANVSPKIRVAHTPNTR